MHAMVVVLSPSMLAMLGSLGKRERRKDAKGQGKLLSRVRSGSVAWFQGKCFGARLGLLYVRFRVARARLLSFMV